ncbi:MULTISPECIES: M14 family metallopeptidase [unclassified Herbaspirillum]|uniref:M14 family metallopeptidase n=1 Tax=unclassified Herbaspirillum TaxID=2624150 RepID=UPI000E2FEE44|nr:MULTISPECIES: M14 family metallopeptidase [unclassified Herbaspirillum]RFB71164.1 succinylglutamate desuccinylase [Herbaspirillum sp. 3R-3a1]TFI08307.1 succinylglutamate desuccinylase [Herbaspirillum sp. 3R11]TFI14722.1 succinylglutamate desuccinylase [Herbaspirillum sp. 3R-11]TFI31886.1 succinylglutamate desuccinylase [Herbaspirillum sp. 3C11]TFI32031.1 succinylglutamate desuccinylase [Herbaspirillum sp. 3C11]
MPTLTEIRAALPAYPIEVHFPDISRWKNGNTGIDYVHTFDSGVAGPHVMLLALTHGNEVCGANVLDTLLNKGLRPIAGRLSMGFANVDAYERFDCDNPDTSRFIDEDMNRVWSEAVLSGPRESVELRRARAIRPFLDTVDLLLDIHSMHESSPPLMMCGSLTKGVQLAKALGSPEHVIIDAGHPSGTRLRDYARFGDRGSVCNALLVESGQHFSQSSHLVALDTACRFLLLAGTVSMEDVERFLTTVRPQRQRFVEITEAVVARSMAFTFLQPFQGLEMIARAGTAIARDEGELVLTPYDHCVLVQPSLRHLSPGATMVRFGRLVDSNDLTEC